MAIAGLAESVTGNLVDSWIWLVQWRRDVFAFEYPAEAAQEVEIDPVVLDDCFCRHAGLQQQFGVGGSKISERFVHVNLQVLVADLHEK